MANRWYAIHTYSGQEEKVVQIVSETIDGGDFGEKLTQVLMPTQDVVQVKNGKKVKTTRKFFPCYVLVEMEFGKDTSHFIRSINGVTGFAGGKNPSPLRPEEISRIIGRPEKVTQEAVSEVPFEIGDSVKIKEGPFKDFDGVVDEIHPEKGKVKVMVSVFGRQTPVEVDFIHVNPIS